MHARLNNATVRPSLSPFNKLCMYIQDSITANGSFKVHCVHVLFISATFNLYTNDYNTILIHLHITMNSIYIFINGRPYMPWVDKHASIQILKLSGLGFVIRVNDQLTRVAALRTQGEPDPLW